MCSLQSKSNYAGCSGAFSCLLDGCIDDSAQEASKALGNVFVNYHHHGSDVQTSWGEAVSASGGITHRGSTTFVTLVQVVAFS